MVHCMMDKGRAVRDKPSPLHVPVRARLHALLLILRVETETGQDAYCNSAGKVNKVAARLAIDSRRKRNYAARRGIFRYQLHWLRRPIDRSILTLLTCCI